MVIVWDTIRFVSLSDMIVKSDEPPVNSGVEMWSVVSLFIKFQVNAPAVEGEHTFVDSLVFPEPSETKVYVLSL